MLRGGADAYGVDVTLLRTVQILLQVPLFSLRRPREGGNLTAFEWKIDDANLFTDLRGDIEEDNGAYMIGSFVPRPIAPTTDCNCAPRPRCAA